MDSHERNLRRIARRRKTLQDALAKLDLERDNAIRQAYEAGMSRPAIAKLVELSAQRIDQIRRHSRV